MTHRHGQVVQRHEAAGCVEPPGDQKPAAAGTNAFEGAEHAGRIVGVVARLHQAQRGVGADNEDRAGKSSAFWAKSGARVSQMPVRPVDDERRCPTSARDSSGLSTLRTLNSKETGLPSQRSAK